MCNFISIKVIIIFICHHNILKWLADDVQSHRPAVIAQSTALSLQTMPSNLTDLQSLLRAQLSHCRRCRPVSQTCSHCSGHSCLTADVAVQSHRPAVIDQGTALSLQTMPSSLTDLQSLLRAQLSHCRRCRPVSQTCSHYSGHRSAHSLQMMPSSLTHLQSLLRASHSSLTADDAVQSHRPAVITSWGGTYLPAKIYKRCELSINYVLRFPLQRFSWA